MKVIESKLPECKIIEPQVFGDERGFFYESWNAAKFAEAGIDFLPKQSNVSRSEQGVLRGLHYQWPEHTQGKFVSVLEGEVYDVAVDVRRGSPTFGQYAAVILTAQNHKHFWVPRGFAHGFCVLSEFATFTYLCDDIYSPENDRNIAWNDGDIAIDWPISQPSLSGKDQKAPFLADVTDDLLPVYSS